MRVGGARTVKAVLSGEAATHGEHNESIGEGAGRAVVIAWGGGGGRPGQAGRRARRIESSWARKERAPVADPAE